jgi:hypothetical protein
MCRIAMLLLVLCLTSMRLQAQAKPQVDKLKFVDAASAKYYSLTEQGLASFACDVKVDWDTVPKALLVPAEIGGREGLESTRVGVSQDLRAAAKVDHDYAPGTSTAAKLVYGPFFGWLEDVVRGFMMTWSAKGLAGPIPTEGNIDHVAPEAAGYRIVLVNPRIQILSTKDYVVIEILTSGPGEEIDEHPVFTPSSQGLLFTGIRAVDKQGDNETRIQYEVDQKIVDTLRLPHNVHLKVNDNMELRFSFENCSVERGTVVKVRASPAH